MIEVNNNKIGLKASGHVETRLHELPENCLSVSNCVMAKIITPERIGTLGFFGIGPDYFPVKCSTDSEETIDSRDESEHRLWLLTVCDPYACTGQGHGSGPILEGPARSTISIVRQDGDDRERPDGGQQWLRSIIPAVPAGFALNLWARKHLKIVKSWLLPPWAFLCPMWQSAILLRQLPRGGSLTPSSFRLSIVEPAARLSLWPSSPMPAARLMPTPH